MPVMSELSPELQELLRAVKSDSRPSEADLARVFEALRMRLVDAAASSRQPHVHAHMSS